jgi:hypothetical protein
MELTRQMLANVPSTVTFLDLEAEGKNELKVACTEILSLLPPHIEHLNLYGVSIQAGTRHAEARKVPDENVATSSPNSIQTGVVGDENDFMIVKWPSSLKWLELQSQCIFGSICCLPPFLERLDVMSDWPEDDPSLSLSPFKVSSLPKTLKYFYVSMMLGSPGIVLDAPLPPHLEYWAHSLKITSEEDLRNFVPKSVRTMSGAQSYPRGNAPLAEVFPNLSSVEFKSGQELRNSGSRLFHKLRQMSVKGEIENSDFDMIPPTVERLACHVASPMQLASLPTQLINLNIDSRIPSSESWDKGDWSRLPPRLKDLHSDTCRFENSECFTVFPKTLTLFGISIVKETELLKEDPRTLMNHLVEGCPLLEVFNIDLRIENMACIHWLSEMKGFKNLTRLSLFCRSYPPPLGLPDTYPQFKTKEIFSGIPRSVKSLMIPFPVGFGGKQEETLLPIDLFSCLPPKLGFCSFSSLYFKERVHLSDEHFAHLPKSLTTLMFSSVAGLSSNVFKVLPPYIAHIQFHSDLIANQERAEYYNQPHWDGVPPEGSG